MLHAACQLSLLGPICIEGKLLLRTTGHLVMHERCCHSATAMPRALVLSSPIMIITYYSGPGR